ncbi:tRNA uridine-5-carboxymethylaminomethyl(34) synthesis GTPase MnmE [uncultured Ruminococcus sp.]|uniref:tRNA uridine-5-carboxymethylaminomethyl(34) synthesis GTPase MnmE n=1 Tax=uncultured Ruminococcus sp. TaxID=165186 RepID=UPI0025E6E94A|nr:tRNA uridine-5-carboxymethylaminomethyl(34) synthesis GTPase MnmE [uncultured Ruminococcus sp.]
MSTIAAISTPNAMGGIAVIRISGEDALEVAEKIFSPFGKKKVADMEGYTCAYGIAHDGEEHLDDCILTVFRAPHSYTGEDIAELSCHGGLYVTRKVLRAALANGAVNAEAGEFTKRAYLNGKLDLTQAEAVMDIISAKGERELKMAESLREGAAFRKAKKCSDKLLKILGDLAAWADYPEEDIPEVRPEVLSEELKSVRDDLSSLIKNYDSGRILREGVATAIIGRPNVGKSTLFNCLSGCERSIVTEIAGTTRDIIEESVRIGDITLRLSDTAGIHETDDVIEGIGVEMAEKMISKSELVIAVFDGSCPLTEDDLYLINKINKSNTVAVINKNDIEQFLDTSLLEQKIQHIVYLSAKENTGVNDLYDKIQTIFKLNEADFDTATAANERQKKCIDKALEGIESAISSLEIGEMLDAVNILVDEAEQSLLMLTGEKVTDVVVDEVFSRFCVGK